MAEDAEDEVGVSLYRDPGQVAVDNPAAIPAQMLEFAQNALRDALKDPLAYARGLGEYMTEPKPSVWFDRDGTGAADSVDLLGRGVRLDRRSKMMFDDHHVFINGESFTASGRDAVLMLSLIHI